jgi:hypothetical protein
MVRGYFIQMVALIVEIGTGNPASNSYGSSLESLDYLSVKGLLSASWVALTPSGQENYLMWASRLLDQRAYFPGHKTFATSGLRWPRVGVLDKDGISLPNDSVPKIIKAVTFEIAHHLLVKGLDPNVAPDTLATGNVKRLKADVVEIEYDTKSAGTEIALYFPAGINLMLRPIGSLPVGNGSRFAKLLRV